VQCNMQPSAAFPMAMAAYPLQKKWQFIPRSKQEKMWTALVSHNLLCITRTSQMWHWLRTKGAFSS
jgi:hypothetical protein